MNIEKLWQYYLWNIHYIINTLEFKWEFKYIDEIEEYPWYFTELKRENYTNSYLINFIDNSNILVD